MQATAQCMLYLYYKYEKMYCLRPLGLGILAHLMAHLISIMTVDHKPGQF